jgi:prenyltransferase beta subunit
MKTFTSAETQSAPDAGGRAQRRPGFSMRALTIRGGAKALPRREGLLGCFAVLALFCGIAFAADPAPDKPAPKPDDSSKAIAGHANQVRGDEITPETKAAIEKGVAWLAQQQSNDGGFAGMQGYGYSRNVAMTALAGLAFMEHGDLPGRGKYGKEVNRCLQFILDNCQDSGLIASDVSQGPMYGHGFATLFLGEMYGMTGDDAVKEKLERAVKLIERTQNPEGGWRYQPAPLDADISVTICQVMALRSAREAGIHVSTDTVNKAIQYVLKCQNSDGGFSYMAGQGGFGGSGFPRSAAGCCALYYSGIFEGDNLQKGLDYVKRFTPGQGGNPRAEGHYFYGYYYATQAMFLAGGDYWATFYPAIRQELISSQQTDHWQGDFSEDYATSMALIILQMPNRYLPVFDASTGGGR